MGKEVTTKIKNEKELQVMRDLAKVHKEVFEVLKEETKVGVTGEYIHNLCQKITDKHGVACGFRGVYGFPGNICISVNDCVVHGVPSKKMIFKDGDVVTYDFGVKCKVTGLNTDRAFTMIVGDGPHRQEVVKFLNVCKEALYKGLAKAIVGNRVGDISNAIQRHVEASGFHIVKDLTGHAVGYNLHEKPYIPNYGKAGKGEILKENMTLAIEPIIGFKTGKIKNKGGFDLFITDGSLGAQFEHTIVVKPNYPEIII